MPATLPASSANPPYSLGVLTDVAVCRGSAPRHRMLPSLAPTRAHTHPPAPGNLFPSHRDRCYLLFPLPRDPSHHLANTYSSSRAQSLPPGSLPQTTSPQHWHRWPSAFLTTSNCPPRPVPCWVSTGCLGLRDRRGILGRSPSHAREGAQGRGAPNPSASSGTSLS